MESKTVVITKVQASEKLSIICVIFFPMVFFFPKCRALLKDLRGLGRLHTAALGGVACVEVEVDIIGLPPLELPLLALELSLSFALSLSSVSVNERRMKQN